MIAARSLLRSWVLVGAVFGVLSACAPSDAPYRDASAPMGATTRFDPARFAGDWVISSRFDQAAGGIVTFTYDAADNTLSLSGDVLSDRAGAYDIPSAGVLERAKIGGDRIVVMWVDTGFRTAAIGTASGDFGAILDRPKDISEDRSAAAREVLDFYGWDINKLQGIQP